ncbi:Casein kinase II regulatory subunit family protein [Trichomonas vaginalis G3]|uniref:Casein kinase II subunit beta n=1 Tax=Trichomonas vaginalis (strain ATCC PRA-98 / G3) TaxID=412133 RepID=A2DRF6_TRIV3|nr:protein kinase regulator protein [Trichomonas vaginalis G3]EAY17082.1 Casein kinase II regulatory subunit family protein [Trichomonas vaginalis G3]KAI5517955.1 protein kinase regulator protein [Trichomonas vaginalis G3]|eukprot:XP_001329305.1 Casein kinase II regulatory subunit family protein [Trichomonas vaginalis G3]
MAPSFGEWLTSQQMYSYMVIVDPSYLSDNFNFFGLKKYFNRFNEALIKIRSPHKESDEEDEDLMDQSINLYGLIHARFICTLDGIDLVKEKYDSGKFPTCPRYLCNGCRCLPYGVSEIFEEATMKIFCPNCCDVYESQFSPYGRLDGAFFGPTYVHILRQRFRSIVPKAPCNVFVPRAFGFKMDRKRSPKPKKSIIQNSTTPDDN